MTWDFMGKSKMRSPTVSLMDGAGDVDGVGVGAAMELDLVGELDAVDGAVVVVENFLVDAADGSGFLDDEVGLRIEEEFAADVGGRGEFDLESVFAADLGVADKGDGELVFLEIEEAGIVVERGGFELLAFLAEKSGEFAAGGLVPSGFAVVGLDEGFVAEDEFGVVAVGELEAEGVGAGFAVGGIGEGAFEGFGLDFGEGFAAAGGFDVVGDDLGGILRLSGQKRAGERGTTARMEWSGAHGTSLT